MIHLYRLIRLSSHRLNNVIGVGAIFLYFGTLTLSIPTTNEPALVAVCILQKWFLSLGMSLAIGTIIMKMFRIYYILSNFSPQRMKVSPFIVLLISVSHASTAV